MMTPEPKPPEDVNCWSLILYSVISIVTTDGSSSSKRTDKTTL